MIAVQSLLELGRVVNEAGLAVGLRVGLGVVLSASARDPGEGVAAGAVSAIDTGAEAP